MLAMPLSLEGLLGIEFKGDLPMMVAAALLLLIGYLALGALMQLLVRDLATGLGLTSLIVSPAFGRQLRRCNFRCECHRLGSCKNPLRNRQGELILLRAPRHDRHGCGQERARL